MLKQTTTNTLVCLALATLLTTSLTALLATEREWVDSTGRSKIQAELVRLEGDKVFLKRQDGSVIEVPLDRLSELDQAYLRSLPDEEEPPVVEPQPAPLPVHDSGAAGSAEPSTDEVATGQAPAALPLEAAAPPDNLEAPADESATAADESATAADGADEFIEIIYRGNAIRVPIEEGEVELGDSRWQFSVSPLKPTPAVSQPANAAPAEAEPAAVKTEPGAGDGAMSLGTIALIVGNGLAILGVLAYFFLIEPWRRRKTLREALKIIQQNKQPLFPRAEELLDQALLAGLRKKDIAQARFAMGCLRCILGKYDEAATVLGDLEKSGAEIDRAAAYAMLWVQARLKNHERVERIHAEYGDLLNGFQQTALIASISYLALASLRLARREIHGALHHFDQVRKLEVLADEIPSHLDDHEVVTGIVALFEKNREEAEKHFQAAVDAAAERDKPTYAGRLGLLLCKWQDGNPADLDEQLGQVLEEMRPAEVSSDETAIKTKCPHCGLGYRVTSSYVGKKVQCNGCRRRFPVQEAAKGKSEEEQTVSEDRLLSEEDRLRRNTRLWHCVTRILAWRSRDELSGLPEPERELLRTRLQSVTEIDPDMGDPYLIDGLIRYYFARTDEERDEGHKLLEKAVKRDVHTPEVLQLLDRVNKLAALSQQSLSYFHQLSGQYAENAEVDPELRKRFVSNMNRFSRFQELGSIDTSAATESIAPSLENLQGRGQILQTRVSNIVHYRLTDEEPTVKEEIEKQLEELHGCTKTLAEGAKAFQKTEFGLMESTGEFLFRDEEPEEGGEHQEGGGEAGNEEPAKDAPEHQDDDHFKTDTV